jgi:Domain of unknown function (DUF4253)
MAMEELRATLDGAGIQADELSILVEAADGPILTLRVAGAAAIKVWRQLRSMVDETGHWPVILGPEDDNDGYERLLEPFEDAAELFGATANRIGAVDVVTWFAEARQKNASRELHGPWPDRITPTHEVSTIRDWRTKAPHPTLHIALPPVRHSWLVAGAFRYGGWNDCPFPWEHVAVHHHWFDRYGAEVLGLNYEMIELEVTRPPRDRETALRAAEEYFDYCQDIVLVGNLTIEVQAMLLMESSIWRFWWD